MSTLTPFAGLPDQEATIRKRIRQFFPVRLRWAQVGVWFLRHKDLHPRALTIARKRIRLQFPSGEEGKLEWVLREIHLHDCYNLAGLKHQPRTIVDIGGNVGLFSMIARHRFPNAIIHCYEPNPALAGILRSHLEPLDVSVFHEAVGGESGTVDLVPGTGSIAVRIAASPTGLIPQVSLDTVSARVGQSIDLLKLDCEGAEWDILNASVGVGLRSVRDLRMEYHLWARPGSTVSTLTEILIDRGFDIEAVHDLGHEMGLMEARRH